MPKSAKILLIALAAILLIVLPAVLFPIPAPGVHLQANYGFDSVDDAVDGHEIVDDQEAIDDHTATEGPETEVDHHSPEPFAVLGLPDGSVEFIKVTNTLIASFLTIIVLFLLFFFGTRKMNLVPGRFQAFVEVIIETLLNFIEGVAGKVNGRRFFPILATIFLYVLFNAWLGLLPFYNYIGLVEEVAVKDTLFYGAREFTIINPSLFRAANTDINVPLSIALISFISVEYWGFTSLGLRAYGSKFLRLGGIISALKQFFSGQIKPALGALFFGIIDFAVGIIELLSEFIRIVSFTFRLFGNMTAGEILLGMMAFVLVILSTPFYALETLMGAIQALIFMGLTLVFATMAVTPHHAEEHDEHH